MEHTVGGDNLPSHKAPNSQSCPKNSRIGDDGYHVHNYSEDVYVFVVAGGEREFLHEAFLGTDFIAFAICRVINMSHGMYVGCLMDCEEPHDESCK